MSNKYTSIFMMYFIDNIVNMFWQYFGHFQEDVYIIIIIIIYNSL